MKIKRRFTLLFSCLLLFSPFSLTISCTSQSRAESTINELNDYLKKVESQNNPRYQYYLPILKYKVSSLNGFLEAQRSQGYYFSEAQWNNLNAQIKANRTFYNQIQETLDKIPENEINDLNKGIKSEQLLDLYYIMHGLTEAEFSSFKELVKQHGILNWWLKYAKSKIISDYLETVPLAVDKLGSSEVYKYFETTQKIYSSYHSFGLEEPTKELRQIEKFVSDYEKLAKERLKSLTNVNSNEYNTVLKDFDNLINTLNQWDVYFNNEYNKYLNLINLVKRSYFETLTINPILKSEIYETLIKRLENQIPVIITWMDQLTKYNLNHNSYNQTTFKGSFKNLLKEVEFNNLTSEQNTKEANYQKMYQALNGIVNVKDNFEIYKTQINEYIKSSKEQ